MPAGSNGGGAAFDASVYTDSTESQPQESQRLAKTRAAVEHYERELEKIEEVIEHQQEKVAKFQRHVEAAEAGELRAEQERDRIRETLESARAQLEELEVSQEVAP